MVFSRVGKNELGAILPIYEQARAEMAAAGNPFQWGTSRPFPETLMKDIEAGALYKGTVGRKLCGVFAFYRGEDPTYREIRGGAWRFPPPYGTIHRIAHAPGVHGFFDEALRVSCGLCPALRIDTHEKNGAMRRLLEKHGFSFCGRITADDGTERLAFDLPGRGPRIFDMKLDPGPFARISSGRKTVEMRLYDERRRPIAVGDTIVFENREDGARMPVTVRELYLFENFEKLYAALPLSALGYAREEEQSASFHDMEIYYSRERQDEWGVVGLGIERAPLPTEKGAP